MVPRSALTGVLAQIGKLMPSTYSVEIYNALARGTGFDTKAILSLVVLLVGGIIGFALASYLFSWDSQNTTRRGSVWLALLILIPFLIGMALF